MGHGGKLRLATPRRPTRDAGPRGGPPRARSAPRTPEAGSSACPRGRRTFRVARSDRRGLASPCRAVAPACAAASLSANVDVRYTPPPPRIGPPGLVSSAASCSARYWRRRSRRIWRSAARADRAAARSGPGNRHSRSHVMVARARLAVQLVPNIRTSSERGLSRHYARRRMRRKRAVASRLAVWIGRGDVRARGETLAGGELTLFEAVGRWA